MLHKLYQTNSLSIMYYLYQITYNEILLTIFSLYKVLLLFVFICKQKLSPITTYDTYTFLQLQSTVMTLTFLVRITSKKWFHLHCLHLIPSMHIQLVYLHTLANTHYSPKPTVH